MPLPHRSRHTTLDHWQDSRYTLTITNIYGVKIWPFTRIPQKSIPLPEIWRPKVIQNIILKEISLSPSQSNDCVTELTHLI